MMIRGVVGNKKAASNWTVGKLLAIILLVLVLVLVIYGITTKAFTPLKERTEAQFDWLLIMLNLKEDDVEMGRKWQADIILDGGKKVTGDFEWGEGGSWCKVDIGGVGSYSFEWKDEAAWDNPPKLREYKDAYVVEDTDDADKGVKRYFYYNSKEKVWMYAGNKVIVDLGRWTKTTFYSYELDSEKMVRRVIAVLRPLNKEDGIMNLEEKFNPVIEKVWIEIEYLVADDADLQIIRQALLRECRVE